MPLFLGTTREDWAEHNITRRGQKKQMGTLKLFLGTSLLVTFWAMPKSNNKKLKSYYTKGFVIFFAAQKNRQTHKIFRKCNFLLTCHPSGMQEDYPLK
jgi:hypothetical protein